MDFFDRLGETIDTRWQEAGRDYAAFAAVAERCLRERPPAEHVALEDVIRDLCACKALAAQRNLRSPFGQPPLTVYAAKDFYIDLLFWIDSTTSIHQHAFSGAFHVLEGSSIETRYRFTTEKHLGTNIELGLLEPMSVKHLVKGNTEPISCGREFIHSLFHLHRPSVSVVVRTDRDPEAGPQFNYCPTGIAYNPFFDDEVLIRRMQMLEMLERTGHEQRFERAFEAIAPANAHAAFALLGAAKSDDPRFLLLLKRLQESQPEVARCFLPHLAERARQNAIVSLRASIQNPEHRFLLAVLLTVPRREDVLQLVSRAYPEQSAKDTILRWLSELALEPLAGSSNRYLPGLQLDETTLVVFGRLLDGLSDDGAMLCLERDFGPQQVLENRSDLQLLITALRESVLFRNLLGSPSGAAHAS